MKLCLLLIICTVLFQFKDNASYRMNILAAKHKIESKLYVSHGYINSNNDKNDALEKPNISLIQERRNKLMKRWGTGLGLGALGTVWIFSGNGFFTLGFLIASFLAQNEYFEMVRAAGLRAGLKPAAKTGSISTILCYITASYFPAYHEFVMPISACWLMIWLLIFNKKSASITEISTSLLGILYIGYLPSFWVRLRAMDKIRNTMFPQLLGQFRWMHVETWTSGSIITWWTWCAIVFADVGAYFIGKAFGKTKLSAISSAAGSASPNKTVEGALGGFLSCSLFTMLGAYLMKWPYWPVLGFLYGLSIAFIGLVGDLTASMMKRDAGVKDTGSILPGHGGLLDRIDSYMLTAPIAFFFFTVVIPFAKKYMISHT